MTLPRLTQAGINVKVIAAISEELFDRQPAAYRNAVLPPEARQDLMFVMSGTRRMWPLRNAGSLTDDYSLAALALPYRPSATLKRTSRLASRVGPRRPSRRRTRDRESMGLRKRVVRDHRREVGHDDVRPPSDRE